MLLSLPLELIESILIRLPLRDIINVTAVNRSLKETVLNSHYLWTYHIRQRNLIVSADESANCLAKFVIRYRWVTQLDGFLDALAKQYIYFPIVDLDTDAQEIQEILQNRALCEIAYRHLNAYLSYSNRYTNLTKRYYAQHLLTTLKQAEIISQLRKQQSSSVFAGSILVSRWVGTCLREPLQYPENTECIPVYQTIAEIVMLCRNRLNSNAMIEDVIQQINTTLFTEYGLGKNTEDFYNVDNNRVDKVLYKKSGIPITLAVIYHEVARQLGIALDLINFPRHFLLSFTSSTGAAMYIDCFNEGIVLSRSQCLQLCPMSTITDKDEYFQPATVNSVLARLVRNILAWSHSGANVLDNHFQVSLYKMLSHLSGDDKGTALSASHLSMNLAVQFTFLRNFSLPSNAYNTYCAEIKKREQDAKNMLSDKTLKPEHVTFSIGDVMLHKRYNYTCVIYGWDEVCSLGEVWEERMGISQLQFKAQQPFYKVLADDQTERYVAQENMLETRSVFIDHTDIGKYFTRYDGERFVPNAALSNIYSYLSSVST